ncbi:hypothetical protein JCM9957A_34770 [Kineosporia succinea]|uniref:Uncharacterized protein n=1 Tax=Kineosporia succinea TaxID=84632 RepID=A0ABT9P003_9ACTN|nr:hypothetical protein [Kineosporia succinea]
MRVYLAKCSLWSQPDNNGTPPVTGSRAVVVPVRQDDVVKRVRQRQLSLPEDP